MRSNPGLVEQNLAGGGFAGFVCTLDLAANSIHGTPSTFAHIVHRGLTALTDILHDYLPTFTQLPGKIIGAGARICCCGFGATRERVRSGSASASAAR